MESSRVVLAGGAAQGAWRADGAAGVIRLPLAAPVIWAARLDAVRNFEEPPPSSAEIMRKPLVEREHELRVIAERMFEGE